MIRQSDFRSMFFWFLEKSIVTITILVLIYSLDKIDNRLTSDSTFALIIVTTSHLSFVIAFFAYTAASLIELLFHLFRDK